LPKAGHPKPRQRSWEGGGGRGSAASKRSGKPPGWARKAGARSGRKMGHLSAIGDTPQEALGRVLEAYRRLSPGTVDSFDVTEPVLHPPTP
jgi:hypothetical protein